jgi:Cu2+-containing amine oxidase
MNKSALQDIQKALNVIRNQIDVVDAETKWAALELLLASSASVVALAKKVTKPDTKTVTRTISIPKTKIIKQSVQQASKR